MFREIGDRGEGSGKTERRFLARHGQEIDNSVREAVCVSSWITVRSCFRFMTCTVCARRLMERWVRGHGRVVSPLRPEMKFREMWIQSAQVKLKRLRPGKDKLNKTK